MDTTGYADEVLRYIAETTRSPSATQRRICRDDRAGPHQHPFDKQTICRGMSEDSFYTSRG